MYPRSSWHVMRIYAGNVDSTHVCAYLRKSCYVCYLPYLPSPIPTPIPTPPNRSHPTPPAPYPTPPALGPAGAGWGWGCGGGCGSRARLGEQQVAA